MKNPLIYMGLAIIACTLAFIVAMSLGVFEGTKVEKYIPVDLTPKYEFPYDKG